ncbi:hypothetical protein MSPP1_002923 [Malassezia sp. CBS 17886]|nr:hypothetical protein MSPP1_002923 [Malassezia sp. CBS 17886]
MNDLLGGLFALVVLWVVLRLVGGMRTSVTLAPRTPSQETVDAVHAMFPDIPEDAIRYDLLRTGCAEATCENILQRGSLPPPPADVRFGAEPRAPGSVSAFSATPVGVQTPSSSTSPSLIERFALAERLRGRDVNDAQADEPATDNRPAWTGDVKDREAGLRERKEQMILHARRRMAARKVGDGE